MNEKSLVITFGDISKRFKSIIPSWIIGTGADFGSLQPYSKHISLSLLVYVFHQELMDDENRTREDLIQAVLKIVGQLKLKCNIDEAEKIVDSMMVSNGKNYTFAFEEVYFDEEKDAWDIFRFRFFEIDRETSNLEAGIQVYKLSDESQEIVIKSLEIMDEIDINYQQIIAELLIKKGNLKNALHILYNLDAQVRKLIVKEKEHRDALIRNPKETLYQNTQRWRGMLEKEVRNQFKEENQRYFQMERVLRKIDVVAEHRSIFIQLTKEIDKSRKLHDHLASLVLDNFSLELKIRSTVFDLMWLSNRRSFREDIWNSQIKKKGLEHPDDMLSLAEFVLSPTLPFFMPLEWGIQEHLQEVNSVFDNDDSNESIEISLPIEYNWDIILELWEQAFHVLIKDRELSISWLQTLDSSTFLSWMENREALDFWISFASMEEPLVIDEYMFQNDSDDKVILIKKLMDKSTEFSVLLGKKIQIYCKSPNEINFKGKLLVSNYTLQLEET